MIISNTQSSITPCNHQQGAATPAFLPWSFCFNICAFGAMLSSNVASWETQKWRFNYQRAISWSCGRLAIIKGMSRFELLVETLQDPSISGQHPLLQIAAWSNTCILLYIHVPNLMNYHNPPTWLTTWHKPPSLHRSNGHWYPIHGTQKINRSTHHLLSCHASKLFFHFLHSKIQR